MDSFVFHSEKSLCQYEFLLLIWSAEASSDVIDKNIAQIFVKGKSLKVDIFAWRFEGLKLHFFRSLAISKKTWDFKKARRLATEDRKEKIKK